MSTAAFPSPGVVLIGNDDQPYQQGAYEGMTLRDYFAAKAMQGICANSRWNATNQVANMARESFAIADAMLKARDQ